MSGGQQITSGQGTLGVFERHGQEIQAFQGFVTPGASNDTSDVLAGGASTSAAGTSGSARLVFLRSRKVGGGTAANVLTGQQVESRQNVLPPSVSSRLLTTQLGTLAQGAFGKARTRALTGSSATMSAQSMTTQGGPGVVDLTWTASVTPGITGYRVYYGTSSGVYSQPLGSGISVGNVTNYRVTGLATGTYYFAVTAINATYEGPYSSEVTKVVT